MDKSAEQKQTWEALLSEAQRAGPMVFRGNCAKKGIINTINTPTTA